jgi:hypothetical protein
MWLAYPQTTIKALRTKDDRVLGWGSKTTHLQVESSPRQQHHLVCSCLAEAHFPATAVPFQLRLSIVDEDKGQSQKNPTALQERPRPPVNKEKVCEARGG